MPCSGYECGCLSFKVLEIGQLSIQLLLNLLLHLLFLLQIIIDFLLSDIGPRRVEMWMGVKLKVCKLISFVDLDSVQVYKRFVVHCSKCDILQQACIVDSMVCLFSVSAGHSDRSLGLRLRIDTTGMHDTFCNKMYRTCTLQRTKLGVTCVLITASSFVSAS